MLIDIGGTPANVLGSNKIYIARANGISSEQLIAILDPFDLSRAERKLELGDYKIKAIKFSVDVPENKNEFNSEMVNSPNYEEFLRLFESAEGAVIGRIQGTYGKRINIQKIKEKYSILKERAKELSQNSGNLREFMDGLIKLLAPGLKIAKLEDILSQNYSIVYEILEKTDIPARAICPSCNCFTEVFLKPRFSYCSNCSKELLNEDIIKSGKYIPQQGFLPVITYFCGYLAYSNSKEKIEQTESIMKMLGKSGSPVVEYKEAEKRTMFESFLLGGENEA
jgi:hypothetical protein